MQVLLNKWQVKTTSVLFQKMRLATEPEHNSKFFREYYSEIVITLKYFICFKKYASEGLIKIWIKIMIISVENSTI